MNKKMFMQGIKGILEHIKLIDNTILELLDDKKKQEYCKELRKIIESQK